MKRYLIYSGLLIVGILLGWLFFAGNGASKSEVKPVDSLETGMTAQQIWTCSMHPQVRQPEPGQCPICGMDLIPAESTEGEEAVEGVKLSARAVELAALQTTTVQSRAAERSVTLYGTIEEDERKVSTQSSHIPGRIEKMYVHYEGEEVYPGQLIAKIYSPELVTAQDELLEARDWKEDQPGLFRAAREKLKRWKLSDDQIDGILERGKVIEDFPIYADESGIVSEIMRRNGDYVRQGEALYEVTDLSTVWAVFDAYESDISEIKEGMLLEFRVRSLPDRTFSGKIDFIDPYIPSGKRTARVRVIVPNGTRALKPGMFATGRVRYEASSGETGVIIPKTAVLWTGERSVVYVEDPVADVPTYRLRTVSLGREMDDRYLVLNGLYPGEKVVTHGTFTVDAAAQLAGERSMMMPTAEAPERAIPTSDARLSLSGKEQDQLNNMIDSYLGIKNALVSDSVSAAVDYAEQFHEAFQSFGAVLEGRAKVMWNIQHEPILQAIEEMKQSASLEEARDPFIDLSNHMIELVASYERKNGPIYVQHCPMADRNRGADWLSTEKEIRNPYFGSEMLTCGKVIREF